MWNLNPKGQSLLEIVIALGIVLIVMSTLSVMAIQSLQNSNYSQNQVQATKLAQDALEKIKSFRENNTPICNSIGQAHYWFETAPSIWQSAIFPTTDPPTYYRLRLPSDPTTGPSGACQLLLVNNPNILSDNEVFYNQFRRLILIEPVPGTDDQKKFTAIVRWTDQTGDHESKLVTILSKR